MKLNSYTIGSGALAATVTDFGASLTDLRLDGINHALVLGYPNVRDYADDGQFMGAVIGRYANRIAGGHVPWTLDGWALTLERNENNETHLHGGSQGFGQQIWETVDRSTNSVTFRHVSPDGHAGYPGQLTAIATYEVDAQTLRLRLSAESDKDTIINLCHHPYFTLSSDLDITKHRIAIDSNKYLPAATNLVPTGKMTLVEGTQLDLRQPKPVNRQPVNTTFCLHESQTGPLSRAATLQSGALKMELHTTQPGVHYYNGYKLRPKTIGHHGVPYDACTGVCLEAQAWPDSVNHARFPNVRLDAEQQYEQVTEYRFTSTQDA